MSESDTADEAEQSYDDEPYGDLMNLARSAREQFESIEIDTDAPTKDELVESLSEYEPEGSRDDGWTIVVDDEREDVDLLKVQTPENTSSSGSSGPTDSTVLYCLTRAETTDARIEAIATALDENTPFELREAGTSGDKFSIVLPAEEQEDPREPDIKKEFTFGEELSDDGIEDAVADQAEEMGADDFRVIGVGDPSDGEVIVSAEFYGVPEDDEDEEDDSEAESADSEDSDKSEGEESSEAEESESEESEGSEEDEESETENLAEQAAEDIEESDLEAPVEDDDDESEDDGQIDYDLARDRLEDKTDDELYEIAVEEDIDGRTTMSKQEKIEAILELRVEQGVIAEPAEA